MDSGVSSSYVTPDGLMTNRSRPGDPGARRCPAVQTTRPLRGQLGVQARHDLYASARSLLVARTVGGDVVMSSVLFR